MLDQESVTRFCAAGIGAAAGASQLQRKARPAALMIKKKEASETCCFRGLAFTIALPKGNYRLLIIIDAGIKPRADWLEVGAVFGVDRFDEEVGG